MSYREGFGFSFAGSNDCNWTTDLVRAAAGLGPQREESDRALILKNRSKRKN